MRPYCHPLPHSADIADSSAPILAGNSVPAHSLRQLVALVADAHDPILLTGPKGAGKRALAQAIHDLSPFAPRPLVEGKADRFNLDLLEARWEGTLFISDVHLMAVNTQLALLRWLECAGSRGVRLVAATHQTVDQDMIIAPLHRLLWRLRIPCPPLERRRGDIAAITQSLWQADRDRLAPILDDDGWSLLAHHRRTATFRDLESIARRLQHQVGGQTLSAGQVRHIIEGAGEKWLDCNRFDLKQHLAQEERRFMVEALLRSNGVVAGAATLAGLKRTTFLAKMKRHGLARM